MPPIQFDHLLEGLAECRKELSLLLPITVYHKETGEPADEDDVRHRVWKGPGECGTSNPWSWGCATLPAHGCVCQPRSPQNPII